MTNKSPKGDPRFTRKTTESEEDPRSGGPTRFEATMKREGKLEGRTHGSVNESKFPYSSPRRTHGARLREVRRTHGWRVGPMAQGWREGGEGCSCAAKVEDPRSPTSARDPRVGQPTIGGGPTVFSPAKGTGGPRSGQTCRRTHGRKTGGPTVTVMGRGPRVRQLTIEGGAHGFPYSQGRGAHGSHLQP
jgi:hypothetical protein